MIILRSYVVNGLAPRLPSLSQSLIILTHMYDRPKDVSVKRSELCWRLVVITFVEGCVQASQLISHSCLPLVYAEIPALAMTCKKPILCFSSAHSISMT